MNGILGGKPGLKNTTVVSEAQANFTVRLAPGQDPAGHAGAVAHRDVEVHPQVAAEQVDYGGLLNRLTDLDDATLGQPHRPEREVAPAGHSRIY